MTTQGVVDRHTRGRIAGLNGPGVGGRVGAAGHQDAVGLNEGVDAVTDCDLACIVDRVGIASYENAVARDGTLNQGASAVGDGVPQQAKIPVAKSPVAIHCW